MTVPLAPICIEVRIMTDVASRYDLCRSRGFQIHDARPIAILVGRGTSRQPSHIRTVRELSLQSNRTEFIGGLIKRLRAAIDLFIQSPFSKHSTTWSPALVRIVIFMRSWHHPPAGLGNQIGYVGCHRIPQRPFGRTLSRPLHLVGIGYRRTIY